MEQLARINSFDLSLLQPLMTWKILDFLGNFLGNTSCRIGILLLSPMLSDMMEQFFTLKI